MGDRQNRFKIAPLVGIGLAAAIAWLGAGEAWSATVGPNIGGGGPRISTPSISTVGPRGGNFRIGPGTEPKGNPEIGDGRPPRKKGGSNIVIIPPGSGGPPKVTLGGSSGTPFRRISNGVPPAGELRYIPNKVVIEIGGNPSREATAALARRFNLTRIESLHLSLTNSTIFLWQVPDQRTVSTVIKQLEAQRGIKASPEYIYTLSQSEVAVAQPEANAQADKPLGDPAQYTPGKLRLQLAHGLAKGDQVLVAVIDSGVDTAHPEFGGVIADSFDTLDPAEPPHAHGTAIAGAIAAHSRLMGVAPSAKILAIRAFGESKGSAEGTTFNILKSLDWAVSKGAQIINMSFAGPRDPALGRSLAAARQKGVVLIAAAGNAGPKSPPLYPAADSNVIAVTATDSDDKLFNASNRGEHIAIAAPGVDILLPSPGASYQVSSGTSFAAAHVSGIAALMLERKRDLKPEAVRRILVSTAKDLGPKGRDIHFGAGLADAYQALTAAEAGGSGPSNASASR
jgi:subtilisin family serine protease